MPPDDGSSSRQREQAILRDVSGVTKVLYVAWEGARARLVRILRDPAPRTRSVASTQRPAEGWAGGGQEGTNRVRRGRRGALPVRGSAAAAALIGR